MFLVTRDIFLGCAKKNSNKEYHGNFYHYLDTASCCYTILKKEPSLVSIIAPFLKQKYDFLIAIKILSFLAGLHDLGKHTPGFQQSILSNEWDSPFMLQWKSLKNYWEDIEKYNYKSFYNINHGYISTKSLLDYFNLVIPKLDKNNFIVKFSIAIGQHHDKFYSENNPLVLPYYNEINYYKIDNSYLGNEHWEKLRFKIIEVFWNVVVGNDLSIKEFANDFNLESLERDVNYEVIFAGLVCSADWIASNEKFFSYESAVRDYESLLDYYEFKKQTAKKILEGKLFWGGENCKYFQHKSFKEIFGFEPRSFQNETYQLAQKITAPSLTIIEAPMGLGKTEASLSLLTSPFAQNSRGLYFALPTQATSNQMFARVHQILENLFGEANKNVNLQILHANKKWNEINIDLLNKFNELNQNEASLNDEVTEIYEEDDLKYFLSESTKGTIACPWFENSRTGLLAEFGVGTIDQVLNSVFINSKHYFVKLFGLAGKTVILDEIHAYDAYMDEAICCLLEWLAHLNCQVILISATLPKDKRDKFLNAFNNSNRKSEKVISADFGFPRITNVTKDNSHFNEIIINSLDVPNKKTPTKLYEISSLNDVAKIIKSNLICVQNQYRGVVGIVCNTVKTAQELYFEFLNEGFNKEELLLFHARYTLNVKNEKENYVKDSLGKYEFCNFINNKPTKRPQFKIIIATQVIEQSLDIDFDFLYSFLCPIDLLLQRMGRHYRRCRWGIEQNAVFNPTLFGIFHEECSTSELPEFNICRGSNKVYYESVLLKSYVVLKEFLLKNNNIIDDIFDLEYLVQKVYSNNETENAFKRIYELEQKKNSENIRDSYKARNRIIYTPQKYKNKSKFRKNNWFLDLIEDRNSNELPERTMTRLFDNSQQIIIVIKFNNKNCYLNSKNEIIYLPELNTNNPDEVKLILSLQLTIPFYIFAKIDKSIFESYKTNKILKHYKILKLEWSDNYAYKIFSNFELRYCSILGLRLINSNNEK